MIVCISPQGKLIIDGETYPGITVQMSKEPDGSGMTPVPGSPFYDAKTDVYDEAGVELLLSDNGPGYRPVIKTRFLQTAWTPPPAQADDLPQTGDSSRLLLWGAMLSLAGAGLLCMKRREA